MAGKKKEASLQVGQTAAGVSEKTLKVRKYFLLLQVSVTNQEQWEEMLAVKGLTGKGYFFIYIICI